MHMDVGCRYTLGALHEGQPCLGISERLQKIMGEGSRKPPWKPRLLWPRMEGEGLWVLCRWGFAVTGSWGQCLCLGLGSVHSQGGCLCTQQLVGCWPQDLTAAEPQSSFSGWIWSCDLVFLRTESSGTASAPFSLSSALLWWRPLYLPRSAVCQCREINIAWAGCCGFLFDCLYIQKLSMCSEQINMALMIGKEKKQTLVIKC